MLRIRFRKKIPTQNSKNKILRVSFCYLCAYYSCVLKQKKMDFFETKIWYSCNFGRFLCEFPTIFIRSVKRSWSSGYWSAKLSERIWKKFYFLHFPNLFPLNNEYLRNPDFHLGEKSYTSSASFPDEWIVTNCFFRVDIRTPFTGRSKRVASLHQPAKLQDLRTQSKTLVVTISFFF